MIPPSNLYACDLVRLDRLCAPLHLERFAPSGADAIPSGAHRVTTRYDNAIECLRLTFEPRGHIDGVADGGEFHSLTGADVSDHGLARVDADADRELGNIPPCEAFAHPSLEFLGYCAHPCGGPQGPHGVVGERV